MKDTLLPVAHVFAMVLMVFAGMLLVPVAVALWYQEPSLQAFVESAATTFVVGGLLWLLTKRFGRELKTRDGLLLVALSWVALPAVAGVPFWQYLPISFTSAYFEAASGLTTSGATVLRGLDGLPMSVNLWRHLLTWLGGMGIIVFAVAILPLLGIGGMQMYRAGTPGPMKDRKLTPRISQTARLLWAVYAGLTLACVVALRIAGMDWFDAICHSFGALSLGGFSTHDANIGYFNSVPIELVLTAFQIVAAMNFGTHYLAWSQRRLDAYARDSEVKAILLVLGVSSVGIAAYLVSQHTYPDFPTALRYASFNLVTIATDGGYSNTDFGAWPLFAPMWMLFLSSVVASSGSTGSGVKMIRTLILAKQAHRELLMLVHPNMVRPLKIGGAVIENRVVFAVLGFVFLYFMSVVTLTFLMLASGLDFISALTAVIACFNNAGPGLGIVGPGDTYGALTEFQTWICSAAMLLGRVEIFTLLVLFSPTLWRK